MIIFIDNQNIFAFYKSDIIYCIKKKIIVIFKMVDIRFMTFYIKLKTIQNQKSKLTNYCNHIIYKAKFAKVFI